MPKLKQTTSPAKTPTLGVPSPAPNLITPTAGLSYINVPFGKLPGETYLPPPFASKPEHAILRTIPFTPPRARQRYLGDLGIDDPDEAPWRYAPTNPGWVSPDVLAAEARGLPLNATTLRMLSTLPIRYQQQLVAQARAAGYVQDDDTYQRLINATITASLQPGKPRTDLIATVVEDNAPPPHDPKTLADTLRSELSAEAHLTDTAAEDLDEIIDMAQAPVKDALLDIWWRRPSLATLRTQYGHLEEPEGKIQAVQPSFVPETFEYSHIQPTGDAEP